MRPLAWIVAALLVAACWLVGSLVDTSRVAYGQTVPSVDQVSTSAGTVLKRRPQIAADTDPASPGYGYVYMVWEETVSGSTSFNSTNLWFSARDPGTGAWSGPVIVYGTNPDTTRWSGTAPGEFHPHIDVDPSGHLHVVFAAERSGTIGRSSYYTVGNSPWTGAPTWATPRRLDYVSYPGLGTGTAGNLYQLDTTRIFVRTDPGGTYAAMGYVLWTGNSTNGLKLTRVGYDPGTNMTAYMDASPISNPVVNSNGTVIQAAPMAILEESTTELQLVYITSGASGFSIWGAPLTLNAVGPPSWSTNRASVAGTNGADCGPAGCTGGTAIFDAVANATWVAANYDADLPRRVQTTMRDITPLPTVPTSTAQQFFVHDPATTTVRMERQPVIVHDAAIGPVVIYTKCDLATGSNSTCSSAEPLRNLYYRVFSYSAGTVGAWGAESLANTSTAGDQKDLAAVTFNGDLYYAWVGVNQGGAGTGEQTYFSIVVAPAYTP